MIPRVAALSIENMVFDCLLRTSCAHAEFVRDTSCLVQTRDVHRYIFRGTCPRKIWKFIVSNLYERFYRRRNIIKTSQNCCPAAFLLFRVNLQQIQFKLKIFASAKINRTSYLFTITYYLSSTRTSPTPLRQRRRSPRRLFWRSPRSVPHRRP